MARVKIKTTRATGRKVDKTLTETIKTLKTTPKRVEAIVKDAWWLAVNTIIKGSKRADFTQMYGSFLGNYIRMERKGNEWNLAVVPPNEKAYWNLYFAEYGAGLDLDHRAKRSEYTRKSQKFGNGYWTYTDLFRQRHTVNTSIPLHYMAKARARIKDLIKQLIQAQKQHKKFVIK